MFLPVIIVLFYYFFWKSVNYWSCVNYWVLYLTRIDYIGTFLPNRPLWLQPFHLEIPISVTSVSHLKPTYVGTFALKTLFTELMCPIWVT